MKGKRKIHEDNCKITALLFVLMLTMNLAVVSLNLSSSPANYISPDDDAYIFCEKHELVEYRCSPYGDPLSDVVKIKFTIYNSRNIPVNLVIRDRVVNINATTLSMLSDTPIPDSIETFGCVTEITWENVTIDANSQTEFNYRAVTTGKTEVSLYETVYVNGEQMSIRKLEQSYIVDANVSDTVTFQIDIKNTSPSLFVKETTKRSPILCSVSATLSDEYFFHIETTPLANSTSFMDDASIVAWSFLLNDPVSLNLTATIKGVSNWGEVPIDPVTLTIEQIPEFYETQIEDSIEKLEEAIEDLSDQRKAINNFPSFLRKIFKDSIDELATEIDDLNKEKTDLEEKLLLIKHRKPFNIEVNQIHALYDYKVDVVAENHRRETSFEEAEWSIKRVEITNTGESPLIVNELMLKASNDQATLEPKYILVLVDGDWRIDRNYRKFYGDLSEIGIHYEVCSGRLFLSPSVLVNMSETWNVLVDWAGRPIQLIFESDQQPEVECNVQAVPHSPDVFLEAVNTQVVCLINQPFVLTQNITLPGELPDPSEEGDWFVVLETHWWSILAISSVAIFCVIIVVRKKKSSSFNEEDALSRWDYVLETRNLTKIYNGVHALSNVNLRVKQGEFISIMGPSGSGKTTLLNLIGALDEPTKGEVMIRGKSVKNIRDLEAFRNREVGFIFQFQNLLPVLNARENVEIPLHETDISKEERRIRSLELLKAVKLERRADHRPTQLSGGEVQRVAIARALVNNPSIVLADEPTGELDSATGQEVVDLMKEINRKRKKTFIIVTHDIEVAKQTDRIIHLRDGKITHEEITNDL